MMVLMEMNQEHSLTFSIALHKSVAIIYVIRPFISSPFDVLFIASCCLLLLLFKSSWWRCFSGWRLQIFTHLSTIITIILFLIIIALLICLLLIVLNSDVNRVLSQIIWWTFIFLLQIAICFTFFIFKLQ